MPWVKVPLAAAEQQLKRAAIRCDESLSRVTLVWLKIQESAQQLNSDGQFELDRVELAFNERVGEDKIDAIVREFESEAVGLIVHGRCATFVPMEPSRDQRHRLRAKAHGARGEETPGGTTADAGSGATISGQNPDSDDLGDGGAATIENREAASREAASASREVVSASRKRTESSDSTERIESRIPSGSVVCERLHDATTTIRGRLVSELLKAANGRIAEKVVRAGVPFVENWTEQGFDLERDILPEIAEIAAKSTKPLMSFSAAFVLRQIAMRQARRLADLRAVNGEPFALEPLAEVPFSRAPPPGRSFGADWELQAMREVCGNE